MTPEFGDWNWPWVLSHAGVWAIVMARVLGLCLTAPVLAIPELDWRLRFLLAVVLGVVLLPVIDPLVVPPSNWSSTAWTLVVEILTGAILGWWAALMIAGARMAGDLIALQAGLSTAALFDPESGEEITVLGWLYGWVALVVFLALDGPLVLVGALVESYQAVPAGRLLISEGTAALAFAQVGHGLEVALRPYRAPCPGLVLGWNCAGLAEPRGFLAPLRRAGIADSQRPGSCVDST